ncbi:tetratricopeptide repeat protein [Streptomyces sp. NPDC001928]|uniref:tetratricopeptide repeat protein n=1 Tax=Streptomyces sp. NPDC001928 TaxID=3154404 RepID=UPI0033281E36
MPLVVEPLEAGQLPAIPRPRIRRELHALEEAAALETLLEPVRGREIPTTSPAFPGKAGKGSRGGRRTGSSVPQGLQPRFPSALHDPAVWDVRQRGRNPHFTGRDEIIEKVRRGLLGERRAAVRVRGVLIDMGEYAESEQLLRPTRTRIRESLGTDHGLYASVTLRLADALTRQGKTHDAQRLRTSLKRKKRRR